MSDLAWQAIVEKLASTVSRPNFVTWVKPVKLLSNQDGLISLGVPNYYAKVWLEKNLKDKLAQLLGEAYPQFQALNLVIAPKGEATNPSELPLLQLDKLSAEQVDAEEFTGRSVELPPNETVNRRYTFDSFVVGNNNRLAFAAAQAVAENPGQAYNPLFIYGGVGLGKTHLMHAIANEIIRAAPKKEILYTSCETFTGDFINSIKNKTITEFKKRYRTVDVLLVDDIQFLSNKEGTQEEFFHTFNTLHQSNRQIVVTSDRVPKEIDNLEDRLVSRFGWGMIADIQTPNFENRVAILRSKAEEKGYQINEDVLEYVASSITSNVRELEGTLTKLMAAARVDETAATTELAHKIVKELSHAKDHLVSPKRILKEVAEYFSIETGDILGSKRNKEIVYPRQVVMYLLRTRCNHTYPQIGEELGGKDHTTVMHAFSKIESALKTNAAVEADVKAINRLLT